MIKRLRLPSLAAPGSGLGTAGFTLLEVMIAMTIMVIAFSSILAVESSSMETSAKAKRMNIVGMLARNAMNQTEVEIRGKGFSEIKDEEHGQFDEPYKEFTWTRKVKEVKLPDLSALMGGGGTGGGGDAAKKTSDDGNGAVMEQLAKLISSYVSKAIREVDIEIKWKKGSADQSYDVAMYWVDLNSEFQLSL